MSLRSRTRSENPRSDLHPAQAPYIIYIGAAIRFSSCDDALSSSSGLRKFVYSREYRIGETTIEQILFEYSRA